MSAARVLNRFLKQNIRSSRPVNETALRDVLAVLTLPQLQAYWFDFVASRAFSATRRIPDWRPKEQRVALQAEGFEWAFCPKKKDVSGKNIIERPAFEDHVARCLLRYIQLERDVAAEFRSRPFIERFHARLGFAAFLASFVGIPVGIAFGILDHGRHGDMLRLAVIGLGALYGVYLLIPLIRSIARMVAR